MHHAPHSLPWSCSCVISCMCAPLCSYLYLWCLSECSWASELARSCSRWQGIHLGSREGRMHNGEDRGGNEGTLCALWRGWSSPRLTKPKIRSHPKSLGTSAPFCCRKRRVSTNDGHLVWTPLKCLPSQEREWGEEKRHLTCQLRCLSHLFATMSASSMVLSPLSHRSEPPCPARPQEEQASLSMSQRALNAGRSLWQTGYPHTFLFLPGQRSPILSVWSVVLLGRCREERCESGRQEAEGPSRRSGGQHLILPHYAWPGSRSGLMAVLRSLHC